MDAKKKLIQYTYDKLSQLNIKTKHSFDDTDKLDLLLSLLPKNPSILDIGCNDGMPVDKYLVKKGAVVTGVDISQKAIEKAKLNVPNAEFIHADIEKIKFKNKKFDAVLVLFVLFHLLKTKHMKFFSKIHKILKPNGHLLVTLFIKPIETTKDEYSDLKLYFSQWDEKTTKETIIKSGFILINESLMKINKFKHKILLFKKS